MACFNNYRKNISHKKCSNVYSFNSISNFCYLCLSKCYLSFITACRSVNFAPNGSFLFPHQLPPIRIQFSASGCRSNHAVSHVFYIFSIEYRIIKLKDVGLLFRNIIIFILGFVKSSQMFQTLECEEQTNQIMGILKFAF